jgi:hypothetical protein
VEARHTHACDLSRAGRRAIEPAFRWGRTAADPNDRSEREQAQQTNAGLEHCVPSMFDSLEVEVLYPA